MEATISSADDENEIALRLKSIDVGVTVTVMVCAILALYVALTWEMPNRTAVLALTVITLVAAAAVHLAPCERIVRSRWREPFFFSWTALDVALICVLAAIDGGVGSPFAFLFVLPLLFGTLSYPLPMTLTVSALVVGGFIGVGIHSGDDAAFTFFGAGALSSAALMAYWEASNQSQRRRQLSDATEALRRSSRLNRIRAQQQEEVARLGHLALSDTDSRYLCEEASSVIARLMETDFAAVLRHLPDENAFSVVAQSGADEVLGADDARVPAGRESHADYTLTTGNPVVVSDWASEDRFAKAESLAELGIQCGVNVMIQASGRPFGIIGTHSVDLREFDEDDVNFIQAIANLLGQGIERREKEERIVHDALHDPLTGLANRRLFVDRLNQALTRAIHRSHGLAVLFIDLDQFKRVNDTFGHGLGDELLAAVPPRLSEHLRADATIARFSSDEFVALLEGVSSEEEAIGVAERIEAGFEAPFVLGDTEHFVSVSIGIAMGDGTEPPESLIRDADAALHDAKARGRGSFEIFSAKTRARLVENLETENDLRRAVARDQLELYYQPVVRLADGQVSAFEALIRWRHPSRGLLGPGAFIDLAEDSNLIHSIGAWVLQTACLRASAWQQMNPDSEPIGVSVNLSPRQLTDPNIAKIVGSAVDEAGIDPATLRLELTERVLLEDTELVENSLHELRSLGTKIVLDDFGSGFSSLGYLKRLPLDSIKLDRVFIEGLVGSDTDAAIVSAVVALSRSFGLTVVAEGIETADQLELIRELGCGYTQGFYFAKPVPPGQVDQLIETPPWLTPAQMPSSR